MAHHDLYTIEAQLINTSSRRLCDGTYKDVLEKLRLMCLSRGATGLLGLARSLRIMDHDGRNLFGFNEFREKLTESGVELTEEEFQEMFQTFDENGHGSVNLTEFIEKLRPPMSEGRLSNIEKAFDKMDTDHDGIITMNDLKKMYSVKDHPKYLNGDRSEDDILCEFIDKFEYNGKKYRTLTKEEFINYYAAFSASIDNDTSFDLIMRHAYKM